MSTRPVHDLGQSTLAPAKHTRPAVARWRPWVFFVICAALAWGLFATFGWWVTARTSQRGEVVPAGTTWADPEGTTYQVVKMEQTATLATDYGDGKKAAPGTVFQIWWVKVARSPQDPDEVCTVDLMGAGNEKWRHLSDRAKGSKFHCGGEEMPDGKGTIGFVFQVPLSKVGEVRGVQPMKVMGLKQPPIMAAPR